MSDTFLGRTRFFNDEIFVEIKHGDAIVRLILDHDPKTVTFKTVAALMVDYECSLISIISGPPVVIRVGNGRTQGLSLARVIGEPEHERPDNSGKYHRYRNHKYHSYYRTHAPIRVVRFEQFTS